jgi:hypothetical protein
MNKQLTIEELNKILDSYIALKKVMDKAHDAGFMDINSSFYNTVWKAFEDIVDIIDPESWIMWYIYDNDMGERGMQVKIADKEFSVKNRRDLLEVMNSYYD